jgi:hypothetical protein
MKKFISVFLSATISLCLFTACQNAEPEVTETATSTIEYKTIEPPENGWTMDLLNEVIYINGKETQMPFNFSELGEDFTIPDLTVSEEAKRIGGRVYYKNKSAFSIAGDYSGETPSLSDCTVDTFLLLDEFNESKIASSEIITINGITIGSSLKNVKTQMGTSNFREFETGYSYDITGTDGYINFVGDYEKDTVTSITINYVR